MSAKYNHQGLQARKLGAKIQGKAVYRFPVTVTDGQRAAVLQDADGYVSGTLWVTAHNARDAAQYAQDLFCGRPCIQVEVWGPKGGLAAHRYIGFESAIGHAMFNSRRSPGEQLSLLSDALRDQVAEASRNAKLARVSRINALARELLK